MRDPLSFNEAIGLMFRNTRKYSPADPDFGARLGISQRAALAITYIGWLAGGAAMVVAVYLFATPLIDLPLPFGLSLLFFVLAMIAIFFAAQSILSYGLYRLWFTHARSEA